MSKPSYFSLFIKDLPGTLGVHTVYVGTIRESLKDQSLPVSAREIINAQIEEIEQYLVAIENIHKKYIMTMVGHTMQAEIEKQAYELFPDSAPNSSKIGFIRM